MAHRTQNCSAHVTLGQITQIKPSDSQVTGRDEQLEGPGRRLAESVNVAAELEAPEWFLGDPVPRDDGPVPPAAEKEPWDFCAEEEWPRRSAVTPEDCDTLDAELSSRIVKSVHLHLT